MSTPTWVPIFNVAVLLPFLGCALLYGLRSPWWTTAAGRVIFALYVTVSAALMWILLANLLPDDAAVRAYLRVLVLGPVGLVGVAHFVTILRYQRRESQRRPPR